MQRPADEPWLAGSVQDDKLALTAYAWDDTFAIRPVDHVWRDGQLLTTCEIRTTAKLSEASADAAKGWP